MKMKKCGIALSALACVGMLSYGVLTAQAAVMDECKHVWDVSQTPTGDYVGKREGHYEIMEEFSICTYCGCVDTEIRRVLGPLEGHELTVYSGEPDGSWFEECDVCYYRFEYNR